MKGVNAMREIWKCACGWHGTPNRMKITPSDGLACPSCGGTGGLVSTGEKCPHDFFQANVTVDRIENTGRFTADIKIECERCGVPMKFLGLPRGLDMNGAAVSIDGTEARLAIHPKDEPVPDIGNKAQGFTVRGPEL